MVGKVSLKFYVYVLFDWLGAPFYVGKGCDRRAWVHVTMTDVCNQLKNEIVEQTWILSGCEKVDDFPVVLIREDISEADAFAAEIALIKVIGRRDLGTGTLVNLTDGGDGCNGYGTVEERSEHARRAAITRSRNVVWLANTTEANRRKASDPTWIANHRAGLERRWESDGKRSLMRSIMATHAAKDETGKSLNAVKGTHRRWHVARGIVSPDCSLCRVAIAA